MKKILLPLLLTVFMLLLPACKKTDGLLRYTSVIRSDILCYCGENFTLTAYSEKSEYPAETDGVTNTALPFLRFFLSGVNTESLYRIEFFADNKTYSCDFSLDPVQGCLTATAETQSVQAKKLTVTLSGAGESQTVQLISVLPKNTLSVTAVTEKVHKNNAELFNSYRDGSGKFCAEIHIKVTVKDDHPYYYFGICDGKSKKAFLADGFTGEVLAVRNVF